MDVMIGLALAIVVQLVGYVTTTRVSEKTIEIISDEIKDEIIAERRKRLRDSKES